MNRKGLSYLLSFLALANVASSTTAASEKQEQKEEAVPISIRQRTGETKNEANTLVDWSPRICAATSNTHQEQEECTASEKQEQKEEAVPISIRQRTGETKNEANTLVDWSPRICAATSNTHQEQEECINANSTSSYSSDTNRTSTTTPLSSPIVLSIPFPHMPSKIKAIVTGNYNDLDPNGAQILSTLHKIEATTAFAHARSTFYEHLKGTFQILSAWGQPTSIKRAGMVHTAYSGDLFQFFLFDSNQESERQKLRTIIEEEAESLVYLFGTIHRGQLCDYKDTVNRITNTPVCPNTNVTVSHRGSVEGKIDVTPQQAANILMVTIADYLDQMVDTNGWRDHHQHDLGGTKLYPGNGRPALGFYWFSSICNAIKPHLEVVPDVFDQCETVISYEAEVQARDAYFQVTQHEDSLEEEEQIALLQTTIQRNSFVGEPHILLSQIYFRQGKFLQAAVEAKEGLKKFYTLASCWDKRRSFEYWIGYGRIILLRANRMLEEENLSWPPMGSEEDPLYINYEKLKLVNLNHVMEEMNNREEEIEIEV